MKVEILLADRKIAVYGNYVTPFKLVWIFLTSANLWRH